MPRRPIDLLPGICDVHEAAAILGITPEHLRVRVHRGQIPALAVVGSGLYDRAKLLEIACDPVPSPSLVRSRDALRRRIVHLADTLMVLEREIASTQDVPHLTRKTIKAIQRTLRQLERIAG